MFVRFVDIGGIVYHHCLNFLFKIRDKRSLYTDIIKQLKTCTDSLSLKNTTHGHKYDEHINMDSTVNVRTCSCYLRTK
jgi:hypothetical protein